MASWGREGRGRGVRPPSCASGREAAASVPGRPGRQRLLDQLLSDLQAHLDEMQKMRGALLDAYPLLCAPRPPAQEEAEEDEAEADYRVCLDVAGFAPDELSVQVQGRRLTVRGKREGRSEAADGCVSHEYREVRREVLLPADVDLEALACALDGERLCVRAPRLAPPAAAEPRTIPIALARDPRGQAPPPPPPPPAPPEEPQPQPQPEQQPDGASPAAQAP
ncbi:heat shock protein 30-like [Paroedura picta]|uniref:heat shock protein 30-like n=1 Tax=Paroedura picta TaxID=143630 RepID=UPI0040564B69